MFFLKLLSMLVYGHVIRYQRHLQRDIEDNKADKSPYYQPIINQECPHNVRPQVQTITHEEIWRHDCWIGEHGAILVSSAKGRDDINDPSGLPYIDDTPD